MRSKRNQQCGSGDAAMGPVGQADSAAMRSAISLADDVAGVRSYRGHDASALAERSTYLEMAWLVLHGEMPGEAEFEEFVGRIRRHTLIPEGLIPLFRGMPRTAHPLAILASATSALSAHYESDLDPGNPEMVDANTIRLLAKLPVLAAWALKWSVGQPFLYPDNSFDLVPGLLRMCFATPAEPYEVDSVSVRALDRLLILNEDDRQGASISAVRLIGSAGGDMFAGIASAISALSGPSRCTPSEEVIAIFQRVHESSRGVASFVDHVKSGAPGPGLTGFGRRPHERLDSGSRVLGASAAELLRELAVSDPLLDVAKQLEAVALEDDYFVARQLYPNADFYSGVICRALGFPARMCAALFALGRLPGWIAHWREAAAATVGPLSSGIGPRAEAWRPDRG